MHLLLSLNSMTQRNVLYKKITRKIRKNLQCFCGEQLEGLPVRAKLTIAFVCRSVLLTI
jgi:hypothetical protein